MDREDILNELNEQQREAAVSDNPRILCLAGAGTGKTKTLVSRIARLYYDGVNPSEMLALTFTRAAGQEMKERIINMIGDDGKTLFCNTFHAWAVKVIRQYAWKVGYTPAFTIYDENDKTGIIGQIIDELQYKVNPKDILEAMSKNYLYNIPITNSDIKQIVNEYHFRLKKNNAIDLDGLLSKLQILLKDPDIKELINRQWPYVFVDEFQDTDHRQMDILNAVNPQHLFVVGDDFQSIYKFRGADVSIIIDMANSPEYQVIKLEENYRSTDKIVNAANRLIKHNNQTEKILKAHREGTENTIIHCYDEDNELGLISDIITDTHNKGGNWSDIAILGRTNKQIEFIANYLKDDRIPCRVKTNAADILLSYNAKKLFTWMKVVLNNTDDVSLNDVLNWPNPTIKTMERMQVEMFQLENDCSLYTALSASGKANIFFNIFHTINTLIHDEYDEDEPVSALDMLSYVIEGTAIDKIFTAQGLFNRVDDINKIKSAVADWQEAKAAMGESYTAEDWLDYYFMRNIEGERLEEKTEDAVQIMTAHGSKGLEFDKVIIAGCYQKNFPIIRGDIEEERRLFYVAMTRAKNSLFMTAPGTRMSWNGEEKVEQSIFLSEIDE